MPNKTQEWLLKRDETKNVKLFRLTPTTFSSLVRLVALDLSHNALTILERSHLSSLTSLQLLDVSNNNIHTLSANVFSQQHNLHVLRMSHNSIENLRPYSLSGLSVVSSLDLSHNRLKNIHADTLINCTSLTSLSLSSNQFSVVPHGLRVLSKLKTIDLSNNLISRLSEETLSPLNSSASLYGVSLAGNGIKTFDAKAFRPVGKIEVLNLAHNQIRNLTKGVFKEVKKLRMLRLDNNRLTDINGILLGLSQLRWLNVSSNRLQWFDYAFFPKNLEWLDVHENSIDELSNYYKLGPGFKLKTLDARSNRIKTVNGESLISSLETVLLGSNRITTVSADSFFSPENGGNMLQTVDLTNNKIQQLPLSALSLDHHRSRSKGQSTNLTRASRGK